MKTDHNANALKLKHTCFNTEAALWDSLVCIVVELAGVGFAINGTTPYILYHNFDF